MIVFGGREERNRGRSVGLRHHITWLKFPKVNKEQPQSVYQCVVGGCVCVLHGKAYISALELYSVLAVCKLCEAWSHFSVQFNLRQKAGGLKHERVSRLHAVGRCRGDTLSLV